MYEIQPTESEITASTKGVTLREPPNFITRAGRPAYIISSRTQGVSTFCVLAKQKYHIHRLPAPGGGTQKTHNQTAGERLRV
jgi:hypothetical protein